MHIEINEQFLDELKALYVERKIMTKTEIKRLARHMAGYYLRGLAENEYTLSTGLEIFGKYLEDEEKEQLVEALQEIIERLNK
jgi:hypothetical protein